MLMHSVETADVQGSEKALYTLTIGFEHRQYCKFGHVSAKLLH